MLEAGPRVQAEDQSVIRLAREFVGTLVESLNETADPDARLSQIIADLNQLRHVSITREAGAAAAKQAPADNSGGNGKPSSVPTWFVALVHPEMTAVNVPISIHGRPESLIVTSHPNDEINEIWDGIVTQLQVGSAIAVALFLITMMVVSRALAPIQSLWQAMSNIAGGSYDTRVTPGGPPELAAICTKLNHLAATLGDAVEERRRLAERSVSLQDAERKEIARELHDEFGPYLFALRAHVSSLMRVADTREPNTQVLRRHGDAILDQVNALQQFNRRVLERLRPVGLAELGLREAIGALVRLWGESHPGVIIETAISQSLGETGETADLTIYRTVQEALTNVFRHASATSVDVTSEPAKQLWLPEQLSQTLGESLLILGRHQVAGHPIHDSCLDAAYGRADHRRAAGHRLDRRDAEGFIPGCGDKKIGGRIVNAQFIRRAAAYESYLVRDAFRLGDVLQPPYFRSRARIGLA